MLASVSKTATQITNPLFCILLFIFNYFLFQA